MKKRIVERATHLKKIPGDHMLRFYRDNKSSHPFMSISKNKNTHYGHEMTTHPSLNQKGLPRIGYIRFRKNPNPNNKNKSYYHKSIRKIKDTRTEKGLRLKRKKNWRIINKDLKRLKRIDKNKIKNVRRAND